MKKRFLGVFLMLAMVLALAVNASASATCTVSFTCPSDVVVRVAEGFAKGVDAEDAVEIAKTSVSTEGDTSTYVFELAESIYRFLSQDVVGPTSNKYYNWDKNFIVTAEDVARGSKTIDADPGLLANTGWEQKRDTSGYYVRQYTDELLASEAATVSAALKEKYAYVFTTPTFTVEGKARHQFTTQSEMEDFVADWDAKTDYMTTYTIGRSKGDKYDLRVSIFTTEEIEGKSLEEAAALVQANGKPTVLMHAQMHGDEQSGTEGALATVALLCDTYGAEAIEKINILLIPRVNPDGSEIYKYESGSGSGWRNINRDSFEATQPETKALINLYNLFDPEACFDMHETKPTLSKIEASMDDVQLSEQVYLNVPSDMYDLQYEVVDYLHEKLADNDLRGYYYRTSSGSTGPVTMRGYYGLRGSISVLAEIPGQRKGSQMWERRVFAQHIAAKSYLDFMIENADEVNERVNAMKAEMATYGSVYDENNLIVLDHNPGTRINAKRYIFDTRDGTLIEHRATTIYRNDSIGHARPRPVFYAVPKNASGIAKVLSIADIHGIEYYEVGADKVMELRQYGGTHKMATLGEPQLYSFDSGAYIFPVSQVRSNIVCLLMEPDVLDSQGDGNVYKASFAMQGHLKVEEIYRCENDADKHELSYVANTDASCDELGYYEHYICTCGKAFAENEHIGVLAKEEYIIPVSGHNFVQKIVGDGAQFVCENNCGEANVSLNKVLAACDGVGGTVKVFGDTKITSMVIPADVTLDMAGYKLTAENLTVNEGGKIVNGSLSVSSTAIVNLGENGGWVPVWVRGDASSNDYALCYAEAKTGKDVSYFDNGTRYSFGYKFNDHAYYAYTASAAAAGKIKVGVNVSLQIGDLDADYSFSPDSVDKMKEVGTAADSFFKVNLNLAGAEVDDVVATPYIKVNELGFRSEGAPSTDYIPLVEVATFDDENFTSLEAAVAAAMEVGGTQDIDLIADITIKRPTTLKVDGNVRFVLNSTDDITISGPLTIDGQNMAGGKLLFQIQDEAKLTLDGVTIQNYKYANAASNYSSVGRVEDNATLVMKDCTVKNCSAARRGAFYITGSACVDIDGCTFEGNKAETQYGGVLAIFNTTGVTVKNSSFINNSAETYGGAIYVSSDNSNEGVLSIENCTFTGNSSGERGGAINTRKGPLVINGVTMSGNTVASVPNDIEFGGSTFDLSGEVAIERIKFASGKSIALGDSFALKSGAAPIVLDAAVATKVLGGKSATVAANNESFIGVNGEVVGDTGYLGEVDVAEFGGTNYTKLEEAVAAALAAGGKQDINLLSDVVITSPTTLKVNGNIRFVIDSTDDITISGPLTIDGQNMDGGKMLFQISDTSKLTLDGVTIQNYRYTNTSTGFGSVARVEDSSTLVMTDCTVKNCEGARRGPFYITGSCTVMIDGCTFEGNKAVSEYGGVLAIYNTKGVTVKNSSFIGNSAASYGGAIYVTSSNSNEGALTIENCTFTGNSASERGGAIGTRKGPLVINGVKMSGNTVGSASNDIDFGGSTFDLSGTVAIEDIKLSSGKSVALNGTLNAAAPIAINGAVGTTVLTGSRVGEYYNNFVSADDSAVITASGELKSVSAE